MTQAQRDAVERFAGRMHLELAINAHKGGWTDCDILWLSSKLMEEVGELSKLLARVHAPTGDPLPHRMAAHADDIRSECADIGNLAMMIFNNSERWTQHESKTAPDNGPATVA